MEIILNHIYEHRGNTYYAVMECDSKLLELKHKLFTLEELQLELATIEDKRCDFTIEDGILRCNAMLKTVQIDDDLFNHLKHSVLEGGKPAEGTAYALLLKGVENDFVFLDGDNEEDWQRGIGVAAFRGVKFSHSTMSVYVPMLNEDGLHNKMLILPEETGLKFIPFRFGVKDSVGHLEGCHPLNRQVIVNNDDYWLWETDTLNIYDENAVFVGGLVNQCEADSQVFRASLEAINDYLKFLAPDCEESKGWAGSSRSYATSYGVYFESSCQKLSTACRRDIENCILEDLSKGGSRESATKAAFSMLKDKYNGLTRVAGFTAQVYAQVASYSNQLPEMFEAAHTIKKQLQMKLFWCCFYTYRVRTLALLTKQRLNVGNSVLAGGNTMEYTVVNSFFEI